MAPKGNGSGLNPRKDVQSKIARLERMVARVKPEVKYIDLSLNVTNVPAATGSVSQLTSIAQGVSVSTRIGNYVRVHHIEYHASITGYAAFTNIDPSYRIYLVQDTTQIGDTAPAVGDLVDAPSLPILQLRNVNQLKRFRVLYDSGPNLIGPADGAQTTAVTECKFQIHIRKENLNIEVAYNGTASTDIQKNGLYIMISANATAGGIDLLDVAATSRVGFTDV